MTNSTSSRACLFVIASAAWRSPRGLGGRLLLSLALHRNDEPCVITSLPFRHREPAKRSPCWHSGRLLQSLRLHRNDELYVIASAAWRSPRGLGGRLLQSLRLHRNDEPCVIASLPFRHREPAKRSPWWHSGRLLLSLALHRNDEPCVITSLPTQTFLIYKSTERSRHSGFMLAINSSFFFLEPPFNCFSRAIAALMSPPHSK